MSITRRPFYTDTSTSGLAGNLDISIPTSLTVGDVMFAMLYAEDDSATVPAITVGSEWALLASVTNEAVSIAVAARAYTGTETAQKWTFNTNSRARCQVYAYSGVESTRSFTYSTANQVTYPSGAFSVAVAAPGGGATSVTDDATLAFGALYANATIATSNVAMTDVFQGGVTSGTGHFLIAEKFNAVKGTTFSSGTSAGYWAGITIQIPATGGHSQQVML